MECDINSTNHIYASKKQNMNVAYLILEKHDGGNCFVLVLLEQWHISEIYQICSRTQEVRDLFERQVGFHMYLSNIREKDLCMKKLVWYEMEEPVYHMWFE